MKKILQLKEMTGGYVPGLDILQCIDLDLTQGEAVGIIGLNGSGKSTLGKAVMNMLPYRKGEIIFDEQTITYLPTSELAQLGIAIMQQGGQVFRDLSVNDNLVLALGDRMGDSFLSELELIVPLIGITQKNIRNRIADKLSGGQRHQLSLAMSLARKPRLLILDEPSAGLSPKATDEMYEILNKVRDRMDLTVLLIEQNINKAIEYCDRCLLLKQGHVAHSFTNKDIAEIEKVMFKK